MKANSTRRSIYRAVIVALSVALVSRGGSSLNSSTTITKVVISPSITSLQVRGQQTFTAIALNEDGNAITTATFTWTSSDTKVASISDAGVATAISGGNSQITATDASQNVTSAPAVLTVMPQIGAVTISPISATIKVGDHQQYVAGATDLSGNQVSGAVFQWNVSFSGVASIDTNGLVTGVSAGTVLVTATTGGVSSPIATLNVTN